MQDRSICVSSGFISDERKNCETGKDLLQSVNFYILMERFCNVISREDARFKLFLDKYFNDEGYVDIWRIPHLILDIYNNDLRYHISMLGNNEFKACLVQFLGCFHNYCMRECEPSLIGGYLLKDEKEIILQIKGNQRLMNLVMDTYTTIIENISAYKNE